VNSCYGGHAISTETNNLKTPPAVLIGTPGRIADHMSRGRIDPFTIKMLVLDEFDKSLEFGFKQEMTYIISQLKHLKKRILTSATNMEEIPDFTRINSPITLNYLSQNDASPENLKVKAVVSEGKDKLAILFRLICKLGNEATLVFCNHREAVERVSELLWKENLVHDIFHGGMEQEDRERYCLNSETAASEYSSLPILLQGVSTFLRSGTSSITRCLQPKMLSSTATAVLPV